VRVDMMEGRVAVVAPDAIELTAGEEARISPDGRATVTPKADIEAATAWRGGKVIFRAERLGDAIRRLNR
jgi:ferric-dicitrate binding protein FerR (iron transport regulator)